MRIVTDDRIPHLHPRWDVGRQRRLVDDVLGQIDERHFRESAIRASVGERINEYRATGGDGAKAQIRPPTSQRPSQRRKTARLEAVAPLSVAITVQRRSCQAAASCKVSACQAAIWSLTSSFCFLSRAI